MTADNALALHTCVVAAVGAATYLVAVDGGGGVGVEEEVEFDLALDYSVEGHIDNHLVVGGKRGTRNIVVASWHHVVGSDWDARVVFLACHVVH
jgi:hypothetical protein